MRRLFPAVSLIAALALTAAACGQAQPTAAAGPAPMGDQIRNYILEHPEVVEEAITKLQQKRQAAADAQLRQALADNRAKLEHDPRDYVAGNPNGKVTLVEFFDYRCPYCKASLPELEKLLQSNKDVRLVLKEFPILSPVSESASRAAIAAKAQGRYWPVHQALLKEKNLDEAAIQRILKENGVNVNQAAQVATAQPTSKLIDDTHALARTTGVTGTPAFVIGDKMIAGWVPDDIEAAIKQARAAAAA
jgi:protein-disulfide isomerase